MDIVFPSQCDHTSCEEEPTLYVGYMNHGIRQRIFCCERCFPSIMMLVKTRHYHVTRIYSDGMVNLLDILTKE